MGCSYYLLDRTRKEVVYLGYGSYGTWNTRFPDYRYYEDYYGIPDVREELTKNKVLYRELVKRRNNRISIGSGDWEAFTDKCEEAIRTEGYRNVDASISTLRQMLHMNLWLRWRQLRNNTWMKLLRWLGVE